MAPTRALAGRLSKKLLLPVVGRNKGKRNELNRYIIIFIGRVSFYLFFLQYGVLWLNRIRNKKESNNYSVRFGIIVNILSSQ